MTTLFYPEKFTDVGGSISYTFSTKMMEAQFEQPLRTAFSAGAGADFAHDHFGYGRLPRDIGSVRIRVIQEESTPALLEAAIREARAECWRIGLGYLYRLNEDDSRHRCLARIRSMPSYTRTIRQSIRMPLIFDFAQMGDWLPVAATTGSQKVDADDETFTITNPGDLSCDAIIFRFRSDSAGPSTNLSLINNTNGFQFSTTRDLSGADHELKVDTQKREVLYSSNNGSTYTNDYSLFTIGSGQGGVIMRLDPGDNELVAGVTAGTPDYTLEWEFYPRYA